MPFFSLISIRNITLTCFILLSHALFAEGLKIAVDIGGPTLKHTLSHNEKGDFTEGAIESLKILSKQFDVYFLSYAGSLMESKIRNAFKLKGIEAIIPEDKWIFVRDRADKATQMVEKKIRLLIDDYTTGEVSGPIMGKSFVEEDKVIPLEFVLFDLESKHPWQDVFSELKKRGYISVMPTFIDGIPQI